MPADKTVSRAWCGLALTRGVLTLLLLLIMLAGCSATGPGSSSGPGAEQVPSETGVQGSVPDLSGLLKDSSMAAMIDDQAGLSRILDGPVGEAWLALYHRDLDKAGRLFAKAHQEGKAPSATVGLARVHLARGRVLAELGNLHRRAALDWVRYRRDHKGRVRPSAYGPQMAALMAVDGRAPVEELEAFLVAASISSDVPGTQDVQFDSRRAQGLLQLIASRQKGGLGADAEGLTEAHRERLVFAEALSAAPIGGLPDLLPKSSLPDLIDPMGRDQEVGVVFQSPYYDPFFVDALAQWHFLMVAELCRDRLGPCAALWDLAVLGLPSGRLDSEHEAPSVLADGGSQETGSIPSWLALAFGPALDLEDARNWMSFGQTGRSWPSRMAKIWPALKWDTASSAADVDGLLRAEPMLAKAALDVLSPTSTGKTQSLASELNLEQRVADRSLRERMRGLCVKEGAPQGKRLLDRSMDPNPGGRNGSRLAAKTRVSHRNDRVFLLQAAACLARIGQHGGALDLLHPLAERDPAMKGLDHYWSQLDASTTVGVLGKTSQL